MAATIKVYLASAMLGLALSGCGPADTADDARAGSARPLEGDQTLISRAQKVSDALGGCTTPATSDSHVVGLESGAIVMLACEAPGQTVTHRLFSVKGAAAPHLLAVPDFDNGGWYASDTAAGAELDAGTGVLTTSRKGKGAGECGSEGRYQWDGARFVLQEMHWKACGEGDPSGPPFPTIWPAQQAPAVAAEGTAPPPP